MNKLQLLYIKCVSHTLNWGTGCDPLYITELLKTIEMICPLTLSGFHRFEKKTGIDMFNDVIWPKAAYSVFYKNSIDVNDKKRNEAMEAVEVDFRNDILDNPELKHIRGTVCKGDAFPFKPFDDEYRYLDKGHLKRVYFCATPQGKIILMGVVELHMFEGSLHYYAIGFSKQKEDALLIIKRIFGDNIARRVAEYINRLYARVYGRVSE